MSYWSPLPEHLSGAQRRLVSELRALKDANRLTYKQIGRMTHYSHASWERWLNGKRPITWPALDSLATALSVQATPLRELFDAAVAFGAPEPASPGGRTSADLPRAQTSAVAAIAQLPADTRAFTGRENEVAQLRALVTDPAAVDDAAVTIVAIDGMAGVGKSALAVRAAHLLADRFPDGQLFLDLHGHTQDVAPLDPADALASLLTSLQVPPEQIPADSDARATALRARLAGTRTLIVLDNAATEAQVRPLLPGNGGSLVLITSRNRLKALDEAHTLALDVLTQPAAIALLQALVKLDHADAQDAEWLRIAELCGRLPLALRIAAALLRHRPAWTLDHLRGKLSAALREPGSFTDGERDLSAVFNLSYQTLDDAHHVLPRRSGLTPGPALDADVAALPKTDQARAERLLQGRLADRHLLSEPVADRYRTDDPVRAYAHAQGIAADDDADADARTERDQAVGRLLNYCAHTAQPGPATAPAPAPAPATGFRPARTFRLLGFWTGPDLDLPAAAALLCASPEHSEHALEALVDANLLESPSPGCYRFHDLLRIFARERARAEEDAAECDLAVSRVIAWFAHTASAVTDQFNPYQSTFGIDNIEPSATALAFPDRPAARAWLMSHRPHVRAAIALARERRDPAAWRIPVRLLQAYYQCNLWQDIEETHRIGLEAARAAGDMEAQCRLLGGLSWLNQHYGRIEEALRAGSEALSCAAESGNRRLQYGALSSYADALCTAERYEEALDLLERPFADDALVNDKMALATRLGNIGSTLHLLGRRSAAMDRYIEALTLITHERGARFVRAALHDGLGRVHRTLGENDLAAAAYQNAVELREKLGNLSDLAASLGGLSDALAAAGFADRAKEAWRRALVAVAEIDDPVKYALRTKLPMPETSAITH